MIEREVDTEGPGAPIETVETVAYLGSDQIEGSSIFGPDRTKIGYIHNFMVDKQTWQIAYVIVSDRGFLGFAGHWYMRVAPKRLTYDEQLGGYLSDLTADILRESGRESADDAEMQIW